MRVGRLPPPSRRSTRKREAEGARRLHTVRVHLLPPSASQEKTGGGSRRSKKLRGFRFRSFVRLIVRHIHPSQQREILCFGGATALFAAGADPTVIRTMGRWSSDCYRLYVRACHERCRAWTKRAGSMTVTDKVVEFDEVDYY